MTLADDQELLGLAGEVALVTGGAMGIGRGCAIQLARAGCDVAITDLDEQAANRTVAEIQKMGRRAFFVSANVRKADQVRSMVDKVVQAMGKLDIAVNNVGNPTGGPKPFMDYTEQVWDDNIEQNLKSCFLCCHNEARVMIERGTPGRIVNVASVAGLRAAVNVSAYGAAKAGIINLTQSLAIELARHKIRVNCIVPGNFLTEKRKETMTGAGSTPERLAYFEGTAKSTPLGRFGDPTEAGGLAVFFASRLSSYVTGQSLSCDGGVSVTTPGPRIVTGKAQ